MGSMSKGHQHEKLVYSTAARVYLTAMRGKAWLEMTGVKKMQTENELRVRQRSALVSPHILHCSICTRGSGAEGGDLTKDL